MSTGDFARTMRILGVWFVLASVLPVVVDGRAVLLPVFAGAVLAYLRRMKPIVASPNLRRSYRGAVAAAAIVLVGSLVALIPVVEPGAAMVLLWGVTAWGTICYASLLDEWSREARWPEARSRARLARAWLIADLVIAGVFLFAFLWFVEPDEAMAGASLMEGHLFARTLSGTGAAVAVGVVAVGWVVALVALSLASRTIRRGLERRPTVALAPS